MNDYIEALKSALQSHIDKRAGKITSLELFREGYKYLGRKKAQREVEDDLYVLRQKQGVAKRAIGMIVEQQRYIDFLSDIIASQDMMSVEGY